MDPITNQLTAFPPVDASGVDLALTDGDYDKLARVHVQALSRFSRSDLKGGLSQDDDFLDTLDPAHYSLSYLRILVARIFDVLDKQNANTYSDKFAPSLPLWQKTLAFLETFNPIQIRYDGQGMRKVLVAVATQAHATSSFAAAIAPIKIALLRIDPSAATFTSTHTEFAQLCLAAGAPAAALPILSKDIYHFPPLSNRAAEVSTNSLTPYLCSSHESSSTYISTASGLTEKLEYQDHLQYFLYGAMCYMALQDWSAARHFLEIVIVSSFANTVSKIQVEAVKKWYLVGLLLHGKSPSLPLPANTQPTKIIQNLCRPYSAIEEAFRHGIANRKPLTTLVSEVQIAQHVFVDDHNYGLVRQVIDAYRQFSVQRLDHTYAAMTIADIAQRTSEDPRSFAETGRYITDLIVAGKLDAVITSTASDPALWIVKFNSSLKQSTEHSSSHQDSQELQRHAEKVKFLSDQVKESDRKYSLNKEYLQSVRSAKRSKTSSGTNENEEIWQAAGDAYDEDMMADL